MKHVFLRLLICLLVFLFTVPPGYCEAGNTYNYSDSSNRLVVNNPDTDKFLNSALTRNSDSLSSSRWIGAGILGGMGVIAGGIGLLVSSPSMKQWLLVTGGPLLLGGIAYVTPLGGAFGGCGSELAPQSSQQERELCLEKIMDAKKRQQLITALSISAAGVAGVISTLAKPGSNAATGYVYTATGQGTETDLEFQWIFNAIYLGFGAVAFFVSPDTSDLTKYNDLKKNKTAMENILSTTQISLLPISNGGGLAATFSF